METHYSFASSRHFPAIPPFSQLRASSPRYFRVFTPGPFIFRIYPAPGCCLVARIPCGNSHSLPYRARNCSTNVEIFQRPNFITAECLREDILEEESPRGDRLDYFPPLIRNGHRPQNCTGFPGTSGRSDGRRNDFGTATTVGHH